MSNSTGSILASAQKGGRTISLVIDQRSGGISTYLYDSSSAATNGYIARWDGDGTFTPLGGAAGFAPLVSPAFTGGATFSGAVGITASSAGQVPLTVTAAAGATADAFDVYVGATKEVWIDKNGVLTALSGSVGALAVTGTLTLTNPLSIASGGTGTASPGLAATGSNISVTGSFPNQVVNVVPSPSFSSLTVSGLVTFPAVGTASSGTPDIGSLGGSSWGYSLWDATNGTVGHNWQLTVPSGAAGNLRFTMDGVLRFTIPASGGAIFKSATGTTIGTVANDGSSTWSGTLTTTGNVQSNLSATTGLVGFGSDGLGYLQRTGTATYVLGAPGGAALAIGGAFTGATTGAFSGAVTFGGRTSVAANGDVTVARSTDLGYIGFGSSSLHGLYYDNAGPYFRFTTDGGTTPSGNVQMGTASTAGQFTSNGGVAVGGALTGATTGAFSNTLTLSGGGVAINLTNATSNTIQFASNGYAPPAFTTRSVGTREVYWSSLSGTATEYAVGIDGSTLWWSVPNTTATFRWYGATTSMMSLSSGNLATTGSIGGNFGTLSSTSSTTVLYPGGTNTSGFNITNAANTAYNFTLSDAGAGSFRAGLTIAGAFAGATSGAFSTTLSAQDITVTRTLTDNGTAFSTYYGTSRKMVFGTKGVDGGILTYGSAAGSGVGSTLGSSTSTVNGVAGHGFYVGGDGNGIAGYIAHDGVNCGILGGVAMNGPLTGVTTGTFSSNITTVGNPQFAALTSYGATFIPSNDANTYYIRGLNAAANANIWGINGNGEAHFVGVSVGGALFGATTGTFSSTVSINGTGTALNVNNGDILTARGNSTGVIYLGNTGARYLYYDGSNYVMPGGALYNLTGVVLASSGSFTTGSSYLGATSAIVNGKTVVGAAAANGTMNATGLDVQGADSFSAGSAGTGAQLTIFSTTAAAIDKGSSITLGGNTGNGAASYPFGSIRAAKQTAAADGLYGGYLDFYTVADNGAAARQLRIDKTGAATHSSTVTATNFIATSGAILLSYSGAAAGTGYYYDGSNAAIRTAGSIYFQGANGTGTASIAQVGAIAMSGTITGATYITAANAINASGSTLGATYGSGFAVGAAGSDTGYGLIIGSTVAGTYRVTNIATASTANVAGVNGDRLMVSQVGVGSYMAINTNGDMGVAGSYYAVSKRASKENIRPISFDSVEAIKNVNIYHYRYKTDQEDANERLGFIADEVPSELSDGKSHDLVHINAVLLDAVKKLTLRIEQLEAARA